MGAVSRITMALAWTASVAVASCVFTLEDLVESTGGIGGAGGGGGAGGDNPTSQGGGGASPVITYQVEITYPAIPAAVTDFVLMVRLSPDRIAYDDVAVDAADLRFVDESGDTLAHDVERWQPGGDSIVWVRVPAMAVGGGRLFMRYGDVAAPSGGTADDVWSGYDSVQHFDTVQDDGSVPDARAGMAGGMAVDVVDAAGIIGGGLQFNGTTSVVDMGARPGWHVQDGERLTFSIWFARNTTVSSTMVLAGTKGIGPAGECCSGWTTLLLNDQFANLRSDLTTGSCCLGGHDNGNTSPQGLPGGASDIDWHFITVVIDRADDVHTIYRDGSEVSTVPFTSTQEMLVGDPKIGGLTTNGANDDWFQGVLDEVRVGRFAVDAAWVELRYDAERDQLLSFGAPMEITP